MPLQSKEFLIHRMQPLPVSRETMRASLAAEVLRTSGRLVVRMHGTSMLGAIWPGDVVIFQKCCEEETQVGDIVLFLHAGRLMAHRVVNIMTAGAALRLTTRGDSLRANDPPIEAPDVLGRAVFAHSEGLSPRLLPRRQSKIQQALSSLLAHSRLMCEVALRVHALYARIASAPPFSRRATRKTAIEVQS